MSDSSFFDVIVVGGGQAEIADEDNADQHVKNAYRQVPAGTVGKRQHKIAGADDNENNAEIKRQPQQGGRRIEPDIDAEHGNDNAGNQMPDAHTRLCF